MAKWSTVVETADPESSPSFDLKEFDLFWESVTLQNYLNYRLRTLVVWATSLTPTHRLRQDYVCYVRVASSKAFAPTAFTTEIFYDLYVSYIRRRR
ncbi:hypothetical protein V1477_014023 [Vespula maculifrons]|uniref:Uncharacterized protein n=1 Tax=Vespula maculifrons TaxID=7453 RepID=A0ABD2BLX9_VESMC